MKRKPYCTRSETASDCATCSLTNYGLDCANNPIQERQSKPRRLRGFDAALAEYTGHQGRVTVNAVLAQIPEALRETLTGKQLGQVMNAVNAAYHNGRASHGGLDLMDDCVWLPWGGEDGKGQLIPISILSQIKIEGKHYTLDAEEK